MNIRSFSVIFLGILLSYHSGCLSSTLSLNPEYAPQQTQPLSEQELVSKLSQIELLEEIYKKTKDHIPALSIFPTQLLDNIQNYIFSLEQAKESGIVAADRTEKVALRMKVYFCYFVASWTYTVYIKSGPNYTIQLPALKKIENFITTATELLDDPNIAENIAPIVKNLVYACIIIGKEALHREKLHKKTPEKTIKKIKEAEKYLENAIPVCFETYTYDFQETNILTSLFSITSTGDYHQAIHHAKNYCLRAAAASTKKKCADSKSVPITYPDKILLNNCMAYAEFFFTRDEKNHPEYENRRARIGNLIAAFCNTTESEYFNDVLTKITIWAKDRPCTEDFLPKSYFQQARDYCSYYFSKISPWADNTSSTKQDDVPKNYLRKIIEAKDWLDPDPTLPNFEFQAPELIYMQPGSPLSQPVGPQGSGEDEEMLANIIEIDMSPLLNPTQADQTPESAEKIVVQLISATIDAFFMKFDTKQNIDSDTPEELLKKITRLSTSESFNTKHNHEISSILQLCRARALLLGSCIQTDVTQQASMFTSAQELLPNIQESLALIKKNKTRLLQNFLNAFTDFERRIATQQCLIKKISAPIKLPDPIPVKIEPLVKKPAPPQKTNASSKTDSSIKKLSTNLAQLKLDDVPVVIPRSKLEAPVPKPGPIKSPAPISAKIEPPIKKPAPTPEKIAPLKAQPYDKPPVNAAQARKKATQNQCPAKPASTTPGNFTKASTPHPPAQSSKVSSKANSTVVNLTTSMAVLSLDDGHSTATQSKPEAPTLKSSASALEPKLKKPAITTKPKQTFSCDEIIYQDKEQFDVHAQNHATFDRAGEDADLEQLLAKDPSGELVHVRKNLIASLDWFFDPTTTIKSRAHEACSSTIFDFLALDLLALIDAKEQLFSTINCNALSYMFYRQACYKLLFINSIIRDIKNSADPRNVHIKIFDIHVNFIDQTDQFYLNYLCSKIWRLALSMGIFLKVATNAESLKSAEELTNLLAQACGKASQNIIMQTIRKGLEEPLLQDPDALAEVLEEIDFLKEEDLFNIRVPEFVQARIAGS